MEVTVRNDFLGLCDKNVYNMSDFDRLRSRDRFKRRIKFRGLLKMRVIK
jgi:hypothetical protein